MDPNENLKEQRRLAAAMLEHDDPADPFWSFENGASRIARRLVVWWRVLARCMESKSMTLKATTTCDHCNALIKTGNAPFDITVWARTESDVTCENMHACSPVCYRVVMLSLIENAPLAIKTRKS